MNKTVIGVKFKEAGKIYYFDPKGEKFNKGEEVPFLTMSGRDLGSAIAINKNNVKSIEFIK